MNCVAVSGTALTEKHLTLIKRLTKKVYLCFD
ncbi:MAG: toprim domain-containing protein [Patescibacteria group bacterium]|nr:toprim domain-containing protein [Patescibacteria group bacterium]